MRTLLFHPWQKAAIAAALVVLVVVATAWRSFGKPSGPFAASEDTTYITTPLDNKGQPDYLAALNERLGRGVTPDNNAAVLCLRVCGCEENFCEGAREKYFRMLGIAPLPEKGIPNAFIDNRSYAKSHPVWHKLEGGVIWKQAEDCRRRPWSKEDYPFIADWLAANDRPLSLLVEASKRTRYFDPFVSRQWKNSDFGIRSQEFIPWLAYRNSFCGRDGARALLTRAMLRLNDGNVIEAWKELLACHRLARLAGQMAWLESNWLADSMEHNALFCDRVLLSNARLTSDQIAGMRAALEELPPMPDAADKFGLCERFVCLDWALKSQREGLTTLKEALRRVRSNNTHCHAATKATLDMLGNDASINWNVVLRSINTCFDRIVAAQRLPSGVERMKAIDGAAEDILAQAGVAYDPKRVTGETYSKRIGLAFFFTGFLRNAATIADDRAIMDFQVTRLAFVLAQYHAAHDAYPGQLADLKPQYVTELPRDIFTRNADLHYRKEDNGYVLYSVGPDGEDNSGRGCEDIDAFYDAVNAGETKRQWPWDDIVARMPPRQTADSQ